MATPSDKSPQVTKILDEMSQLFMGRSRTTSIKTDTCVSCGKTATQFRNEVSRREYTISGMCQLCQDSIFGED